MKKLICTSSNDDFIVGTLVMLYSLKKNFKPINEFDIKIYYDSDMKYGNISNENKEMIKKVFPNVIFDNNSDKRFRNAFQYGVPELMEMSLSGWLKLKLFSEFDYDVVMWLDGDMLVHRDFSDVFEIENNPNKLNNFCKPGIIGIDMHHRHTKVGSRIPSIQTGFLLVYKNYLNETTFQRLTKKYRWDDKIFNQDDDWYTYRFSKNNEKVKRNRRWGPEGLIKTVFYNEFTACDVSLNGKGDEKVFKRDDLGNTMRGDDGNKLYDNREIKDQKIFHWAGCKKPWQKYENGYWGKSNVEDDNHKDAVTFFNKIWWEYYNEVME